VQQDQEEESVVPYEATPFPIAYAFTQLSSLSDIQPTSDDEEQWASIQSQSLEVWGSAEGLVSSLSEHLPSFTHCQLTIFCMATAPFLGSTSLCEAICSVLNSCHEVATCLEETLEALELPSQGEYDTEMANDRLVRVFLSLALNYLRESANTVTGREAQVLHRCHQFWTTHATRFY